MSRYIDADKALEDADTIDPKYKTLIEQVKRIINAQPTADVVEGVACKECRFRDVCQQEIKMLGPGIVYEYSLKIEGCSLGEKRR